MSHNIRIASVSYLPQRISWWLDASGTERVKFIGQKLVGICAMQIPQDLLIPVTRAAHQYAISDTHRRSTIA